MVRDTELATWVKAVRNDREPLLIACSEAHNARIAANNAGHKTLKELFAIDNEAFPVLFRLGLKELSADMAVASEACQTEQEGLALASQWDQRAREALWGYV